MRCLAVEDNVAVVVARAEVSCFFTHARRKGLPTSPVIGRWKMQVKY